MAAAVYFRTQTTERAAERGSSSSGPPTSPARTSATAASAIVYEHRPLVCRTFGLPLRNGDDYLGDVCELNFTKAPDAEKEAAAWDLQWEDELGPEDEFTPRRSC
jgi:hypothetical protein